MKVSTAAMGTAVLAYLVFSLCTIPNADRRIQKVKVYTPAQIARAQQLEWWAR